MSTSLTSDFETPRASRRGKAEKVAFVAAKLVVTGACFWYVSRQIEWQQVWSAIPLLDFRWAGLASLLAMLEIPLVGLRWGNVVSAVSPGGSSIAKRITRTGVQGAPKFCWRTQFLGGP